MKIHLLILVVIITLSSAFTAENDKGLDVTYGVGANDPAQIELQLNSDFTFSYQDFSVNEEKVMIRGTYELKNNTVQLIAENSTVRYHDSWRIVDEGNAAKSRLGLTFYTLRKQ